MGIRYFSPSEYIRKQPFDITVPAYYNPNLPPDLVKQEKVDRQFDSMGRRWLRARPAGLGYVAPDPDSVVRVSHTIENMLNLFRRKIPFSYRYPDDVVYIFDAIDAYLESVKPDVQMNDSTIIEYVKHLLEWRAELYKLYFTYMMTHPTAREALYKGSSEKASLGALLVRVGAIRENFDDPVRRRKNPPYFIEQFKPVEKTSDDDDASDIASMYGIPTAKVDADEDFKFDMDAFLNPKD